MKQQKQSRGSNQGPNAQPNATRWVVTAVASIALIILIFSLLQTQSSEEILLEESMMSNQEWSSPPAMTIDAQKEYTAVIETDLGNIVLRLFADESPITVNNFVFLAQQDYYDGIAFHRVIHDNYNTIEIPQYIKIRVSEYCNELSCLLFNIGHK